MGDRGTIVVIQHPRCGPDGCIYLYTHWGGTDLPLTLQLALRKAGNGELGSRLRHEHYLTRIIFERMLMQEATSYAASDGTHGFGISTYRLDNDHPTLVVTCPDQQVRLLPAFGDPLNEPLRCWTFDEYLALANIDWNMLQAQLDASTLYGRVDP